MGKVQQYRRVMSHPLRRDIGQFVLKEGTNHVIGFVSGTDGILYIEVTLFAPADKDSFTFNIFHTVTEVDWEDVFVSIVDQIPEKEFNDWKRLYGVE